MGSALVKANQAVAHVDSFTPDQLALLKRTIAVGTTDDEFALFVATCNRTGLDPFARQIFAIKRWSTQVSGYVMQTQVSVDGLRLIAERTGKFLGLTPEYWCGNDGQWRDVWLDDAPPKAAKIGVFKEGRSEPTWAVATWREYAVYAKNRQGQQYLTAMWEKMPARMLLKCAESLALRKAFPAEMSGLYAPEEMDQADTDPPDTIDAETGEIIEQRTTIRRAAPPQRGQRTPNGAMGPEPGDEPDRTGGNQSAPEQSRPATAPAPPSAADAEAADAPARADLRSAADVPPAQVSPAFIRTIRQRAKTWKISDAELADIVGEAINKDSVDEISGPEEANAVLKEMEAVVKRREGK